MILPSTARHHLGVLTWILMLAWMTGSVSRCGLVARGLTGPGTWPQGIHVSCTPDVRLVPDGRILLICCNTSGLLKSAFRSITTFAMAAVAMANTVVNASKGWSMMT